MHDQECLLELMLVLTMRDLLAPEKALLEAVRVAMKVKDKNFP